MRRVGPVTAGMALALCVPLAACGGGTTGSASVDKGAAAEKIRDSERQLLTAFRSRDAQKIGPHYAEDAVMMAAHRPPMNGRDEIVQGLGDMVADPAFSIDFANQKTEVSSSGDLAYTRGTYTVSYTDPESKQPMTEKGNYLTVLKPLEDGSWEIVEDVASPAAAPEPSAAIPG